MHINTQAVQGWQCPLCKRIYAPFMPMCTSCPSNNSITMGDAPVEFTSQEIYDKEAYSYRYIYVDSPPPVNFTKE